PHGVYPSLGEDRWVAIAVFNDADWRALVGVMGDPAWAAEARFAGQAARFANQDALDSLIGAWTARHDRHDLMHRLQAAGVAAGAGSGQIRKPRRRGSSVMDAARQPGLPTPLSGLTVVELAEDPGGEYAGQLLAELGARVIKVEPPQGSPSRAVGPFAKGQAGP